MKNKKTYIILLLSFLPGLGHLYLGKYRKGFSLLLVAGLLAVSSFYTNSFLFMLLMTLGYFAVMIPSTLEAYVLAGSSGTSNIFSKPYIIVMLLMTGMTSLPILWESPHFTQREKLLWTVTVFVLAALFFFFAAYYLIEI